MLMFPRRSKLLGAPCEHMLIVIEAYMQSPWPRDAQVSVVILFLGSTLICILKNIYCTHQNYSYACTCGISKNNIKVYGYGFLTHFDRKGTNYVIFLLLFLY